MKQVTATGQSVEEAVDKALKDLATSREMVDIRVIDQGKRGLFGVFGSKPATVEVTVKADPIAEAEVFLQNVIEKMGITSQIETTRKNKEVTFQLSGEKIAILIGKRGQTLNSLQYLTQLALNRHSDNHYLTVIVDAENYRERRKETLKQLAYRLAKKAIETGKEVKVEPMPSYDRKIIHTALQENELIKTFSSGEEPNRYVVIKPVHS